MSEENITPEGGEAKPTEDKNPTNKVDIPWQRFDRVVAEKNSAAERVTALETQLAGFTKAENDRLEAEQIAKGEFESTLDRYKEENAALQEKATAFESYELEQRAVLTGKLSENKHALAANMSLTDLLQFVELEQKNKVPLREDRQPGERYGGYKDIAEFAEKDHAGYAAYRKSLGRPNIR